MKTTHIGIYYKKKRKLNQYYLKSVIPYENYKAGYIEHKNFGFKTLLNYSEDDGLFIIYANNEPNCVDGISDQEKKILNSLKRNDVVMFDIEYNQHSTRISNIKKCEEDDTADRISLILAEWDYLNWLPE